MTAIRALWRHPIKGHGREALTAVTLTAGQATVFGPSPSKSPG